MVEGSRTLKCYAWEHFFLDKFRENRKEQEPSVFWNNVMFHMGSSVITNLGMVIYSFVFLIKWATG